MDAGKTKKSALSFLAPLLAALLLTLAGVLAMGVLFILSGIVTVAAVVVVGLLVAAAVFGVGILFFALSRSPTDLVRKIDDEHESE